MVREILATHGFWDYSLILRKEPDLFMAQLQVSNETLVRMKKITGISHARDGNFIVNETFDILEKNQEKIIQKNESTRKKMEKNSSYSQSSFSALYTLKNTGRQI